VWNLPKGRGSKQLWPFLLPLCADLEGADLGRSSLSRANLSQADLREADLSGADLERVMNFGENRI
jgi:hypothetical protein